MSKLKSTKTRSLVRELKRAYRDAQQKIDERDLDYLGTSRVYASVTGPGGRYARISDIRVDSVGDVILTISDM